MVAEKVKNQTRVSSKHQVTIPASAFRTAGFAPGDTLKVEAQGAGRVVLTRIGFFAGLLSAVLPVDVAIADKAADLRSRSKLLRMPDALILSTAETNPDVDLIVTGDQQLPEVSGLRVKVRLLR
jgi:bifunctional DNA-binding transcriptional regulator/antitoxin component of YhaV-PrlF toxin-antitoxin module